jgi:hypothetical protein
MMVSQLTSGPTPARVVEFLLGDDKGGGTALMQHAFDNSPGRVELKSTDATLPWYLSLQPQTQDGANFVWTQRPTREGAVPPQADAAWMAEPVPPDISPLFRDDDGGDAARALDAAAVGRLDPEAVVARSSRRRCRTCPPARARLAHGATPTLAP